MTESKPVSRRRFISIVAATAGSAVIPKFALASETPSFRWHGEVLGGLASITLHTDLEEKAELVCKRCLKEIDRLENIFSLFRANSSIRRLNRDGRIERPPAELLDLVKKSIQLSKLSNGAFDITVQPLWHYMFYASNGSLDPARISALGRLIDYRKIEVSNELIVLSDPGMMITLNGIAQGYITDCVTRIFRHYGFTNVLVELGETFGSGRNVENRPWQIGIHNPDTNGILSLVELNDMALATSGGYGTPFHSNASRELHHLIEPATASSANRFKSVSVVATNATDADGLSTTLALIGKQQHKKILDAYPGSSAVILTRANTLLKSPYTDS